MSDAYEKAIDDAMISIKRAALLSDAAQVKTGEKMSKLTDFISYVVERRQAANCTDPHIQVAQDALDDAIELQEMLRIAIRIMRRAEPLLSTGVVRNEVTAFLVGCGRGK